MQAVHFSQDLTPYRQERNIESGFFLGSVCSEQTESIKR